MYVYVCMDNGTNNYYPGIIIKLPCYIIILDYVYTDIYLHWK